MANLSKEEARQIAEDAVVAAFKTMGIDTSSPLEVQQDMAFLRRTRTRCENMVNQTAAWAVVGFFTVSSALSFGGLLGKLKGD